MNSSAAQNLMVGRVEYLLQTKKYKPWAHGRHSCSNTGRMGNMVDATLTVWRTVLILTSGSFASIRWPAEDISIEEFGLDTYQTNSSDVQRRIRRIFYKFVQPPIHANPLAPSLRLSPGAFFTPILRITCHPRNSTSQVKFFSSHAWSMIMVEGGGDRQQWPQNWK